MQTPTYYTRNEAEAYLLKHGIPCTKKTLAKLACIGGGPTYRLFGNKALYKPEDLMAWAESRMSEPRTNTSEAGC